jgi:protein-disulfide isomerase
MPSGASAPMLAAMGSTRTRLVVVAVAGIALAGGLIGASLATRDDEEPAQALVGAAETEKLLAGIPQRGTILGNADAPVTLVEYADMQCPYCAQWALNALPELIDEYVRPGRVRVEFHGMAFLGPDSERGLQGVLAAGRQDKLWHAVDLLFRNQGAENSDWLTDRTVERVAASISGLDAEQMLADVADVEDEAQESQSTANEAGIDGTPSFQVGRTGGTLRRVPIRSLDAAALRPAIEAALGG